uniref:F-box domain-containing protein n=1 Tax=viral metagenome TaxID=1070528 RepID=A0A6C0JSW3_9ZZZZ
MDKLSNELIVLIMKRLDFFSFIKCGKVCKRWNDIQSHIQRGPTILFEIF